MKSKLTILTALLALGIAGCASKPVQPGDSTSHPANADAAEGAFPPTVPTLMNGTNPIAVNAGNAPSPEHQHDHGKHEMKPQTEEPK